MKRNTAALADKAFDLVIVGAGIYGAVAAWDAALRGLSVALVDKGDFGAATSFNNLKTVHGGLRYLQHGDLKRMRESVRERRTLMRIAPHLVHPLPFLLPTYGDWKRRRGILRAAMFMNDVVSYDRNRDMGADRILPPGRIISVSECQELFPQVMRQGLTGGALWYDGQIRNSDRLTLAFVLSAAAAGARVANFVEVTGFSCRNGRVEGVRATDSLSGERLDIRSRVVLNASGPWVDQLLSRIGDARITKRWFHFSKAMNLVTRPLVPSVAVGLGGKPPYQNERAFARSTGPLFFLVPWRDACLIGTLHDHHDGGPDDLEATETEIRRLLEAVNAAAPSLELKREDVRLVHRGLLPMKASRRGAQGVSLLKHYQIRDHRAEGLDGLVTMMGVKYTTARDVAEKAIDRVFDVLGKLAPQCRTASTPIRGGDCAPFLDFLSEASRETRPGIDGTTVRHLARSYGTGYRDVLHLADEDEGWLRPVGSGTSVLGVEIVHAVREEMAPDLETVVLRRTELGSAGHPGRASLETVAALVARELEWDDARTSAEIGRVEDFYRRRS